MPLFGLQLWAVRVIPVMECVHPTWRRLGLAPLPAGCTDPNAHFREAYRAAGVDVSRVSSIRGYLILSEWRGTDDDRDDEGPRDSDSDESGGEPGLLPQDLCRTDRDLQDLSAWIGGELAIKLVRRIGHWPREFKICDECGGERCQLDYRLTMQSMPLLERLWRAVQKRLSQPGRQAWVRDTEQYAMALLNQRWQRWRRGRTVSLWTRHGEAFTAARWRGATTRWLETAPAMGDDSLEVQPEEVSPEWQPWPACTIPNSELIELWTYRCPFACLLVLHANRE